MAQAFRVSAGLKDLIGRGLITNEFVAVFELVKNSFDAHASKVAIQFEEDEIVIADNGKGMSRDDILDKWLFVAYSAKREGIEDSHYQGESSKQSQEFAGSKGVGRFSCDRLGANLILESKAKGQPTQVLEIDWTRYEQDANEEFGDIELNLSESFEHEEPESEEGQKTGTVLKIGGLRTVWDRDKLLKLKRELAKLINPFSAVSSSFEIEIVAPTERTADESTKAKAVSQKGDSGIPFLVNGNVENNILDVLRNKSTSIRITLTNNGKFIVTRLEDRGEKIYQIREQNSYQSLKATALDAEIYFLNRSAKATFARRMGLDSVKFGSIFLFRNGFRVVPIGEENDDFFGLTRRKQQGMMRFLGSRDLIGRVEIQGVDGFDEATSRDQGLIHTVGVDELITCIVDKCIRRLERYVVDITWKDQFDKDQDDIIRMRLDESSARITQLVSHLAGSSGVEMMSYNKDLVRIVDEKSEAFDLSLRSLEVLASKTGDKALLSRVAHTKGKMIELRRAEEASHKAQVRAEQRAQTAEKEVSVTEFKYKQERERNRFLVAAASLDQDTILNLHHQILMHASDVHLGIKRMMGKLRKGTSIENNDWIDFLERISFRNSQILTASRFATKAGYKQQSTVIEADLAIYVHDYISTISKIWAPGGLVVKVQSDGRAFERRFRPIEVGSVIDNLVSNASKAKATNISFFVKVSKGARPEFVLSAADDGQGWGDSMTPQDQVFEKGTTSTNGSGLGLYHVKQVIEGLGGIVEAHSEPYSKGLSGAHLKFRVPK